MSAAGMAEHRLNMLDRETFPISVVIATLGADVLHPTLALLNSGPQIPAEILLCIPQREAVGLADFEYGNVRVLVTPCKGQVAQRAYGLELASQPIIMQMDDDILIEPSSLQVLLQTLDLLGEGNVVAPLYRHLKSGEYATVYSTGIRGWLSDMYASLICAAPWGRRRMGKVTKAGIGFWLDKDQVGEAPFETEWVPGGCAVCRRNDLVMENYYPYTGQAFTEDLVHSIYWRRKGVRLWAVPTVDCCIQVKPLPFVWHLMWSDLLAHRYVVHLIDGSPFRLYVWFVFSLAKRATLHFLETFGYRRDVR
jgi:glycosyltransferase involved in cell wall biosynthesis